MLLISHIEWNYSVRIVNNNDLKLYSITKYEMGENNCEVFWSILKICPLFEKSKSCCIINIQSVHSKESKTKFFEKFQHLLNYICSHKKLIRKILVFIFVTSNKLLFSDSNFKWTLPYVSSCSLSILLHSLIKKWAGFFFFLFLTKGTLM